MMVQYKKASEAQIKARERNWYIARLRGLWHNVAVIRNAEAVTDIQDWIDRELAAQGAEKERVRHEARQRWMLTESESPMPHQPTFKRRSINRGG